MPDNKPPPRKTERLALIIAAAIAVAVVILVIVIPRPETAPPDPPGGEAPGIVAPNEVETPEEAKPPAERESN